MAEQQNTAQFLLEKLNLAFKAYTKLVGTAYLTAQDKKIFKQANQNQQNEVVLNALIYFNCRCESTRLQNTAKNCITQAKSFNDTYKTNAIINRLNRAISSLKMHFENYFTQKNEDERALLIKSRDYNKLYAEAQHYETMLSAFQHNRMNQLIKDKKEE